VPRRPGPIPNMTSTGHRPLRRLLVRTAALVIILVVLGAAWFLPRAGRYLIVEDPLAKSDAIVVLAGSRVERWLEAVDLYREGWAPRIVLSAGREEEAEALLRQKGIRFPSDAELARDAMIQLHVPADAIAITPERLDNTAQEAESVRMIARAQGWHQLIVVTSKYHTRRTSFAVSRALRGSGIRILVRPTRYDTSTPDRWWTNRADFRFVTSELQKLLAYRLGLGG
jgi:uncharacterized SAM-binding protein YcdF (DUF218 family)